MKIKVILTVLSLCFMSQHAFAEEEATTQESSEMQTGEEAPAPEVKSCDEDMRKQCKEHKKMCKEKKMSKKECMEQMKECGACKKGKKGHK